MSEKVITHAGPDRRFQQCLCAVCGHVNRCVPRFDFYAREPDGALVCEVCYVGALKAKGLQPVGFGLAEG